MDRETLLARVNEQRDTDLHLTFRALLQVELNSLREKNDIAVPEDVLRNQGAIAFVKRMIKSLEPEGENTPHYDGAYG